MDEIVLHVQSVASDVLVEKSEELLEKFHKEYGYENIPKDALFNAINYVLWVEFLAQFKKSYAIWS